VITMLPGIARKQAVFNVYDLLCFLRIDVKVVTLFRNCHRVSANGPKPVLEGVKQRLGVHVPLSSTMMAYETPTHAYRCELRAWALHF